MSGTPLPDGFEALALIARELRIHVPCADDAHLGGLHDTERLVVIPKQNKALVALWHLFVRVRLVVFAKAGRGDLFAPKHRRDELRRNSVPR
jgi:hypothetical protein